MYTEKNDIISKTLPGREVVTIDYKQKVMYGCVMTLSSHSAIAVFKCNFLYCTTLDKSHCKNNF